MDLGGAERFGTGYVSSGSPVIIGGCARSGTTLLCKMLDSHHRLCCGPESGLFFRERAVPARLERLFDIPRGDVKRIADGCVSRAEFIARFFSEYARRQGKERWAEKTPKNVEHLSYIFQTFPQARFIHVVRDGRDVVCSLRNFPRYRVVDGEVVPVETNNPIPDCVERWVTALEAAVPFRDDSRYLEVRYEALISDTENVLRRVLSFIHESWDDAVLSHHEVSRDATKFPQNPEAVRPVSDSAVGRWRRDLSPEEYGVVREIGGDWLDRLGYNSG